MRMTNQQKAEAESKLVKKMTKQQKVQYNTYKKVMAGEFEDCDYFEENDHCRAKGNYLKLENAQDNCRSIEWDRKIDPAAHAAHMETCAYLDWH